MDCRLEFSGKVLVEKCTYSIQRMKSVVHFLILTACGHFHSLVSIHYFNIFKFFELIIFLVGANLTSLAAQDQAGILSCGDQYMDNGCYNISKLIEFKTEQD